MPLSVSASKLKPIKFTYLCWKGVYTVLCTTEKGRLSVTQRALSEDGQMLGQGKGYRVRSFVQVAGACLLTTAFNDLLDTQQWLKQKSTGCCKVKPAKQRIIKVTKSYFRSKICKGKRQMHN